MVTTRPDESVCWQCGAAADPACVHIETLGAWGTGHETLGYPVTRGRRQEALRLTIPRCRACKRRNIRTGLITLSGAGIGIVIAGLASAWHGGSAFVGFVLGGFVAGAVANLYDWHAGRRLLTSYPPMRRLRKLGWHIQGSA